MLLGWRAPRSPGQRGHRYLRFDAQSQEHAPRLRVGFVSKVGRGLKGNRTVFSKGSSGAHRIFKKTVAPQDGLFSTGLVIRLEPTRYQTSVLALIRTAVGCWFYLPAPVGLGPFDYFAAAPSDKLVQRTSGLPAT